MWRGGARGPMAILACKPKQWGQVGQSSFAAICRCHPPLAGAREGIARTLPARICESGSGGARFGTGGRLYARARGYRGFTRPAIW